MEGARRAESPDVKEICFASFLCRRCRLLPLHDRRIPALAVARPVRTAIACRTPSAQLRLKAPEASPKNREERRFSRADKNKDGKIEAEEIFGARRKAFAKLDINGNGALSFEEWATKTIGKFQGADANHDGFLTAAEYATTAPPPPKHPTCSCRSTTNVASADD